MKSFAIAMVFAILFAAWPAAAQTRAQQARNSTGESSSQKQLGGMRKDRKITRHIRHEHRMDRHRHASYHRSM